MILIIEIKEWFRSFLLFIFQLEEIVQKETLNEENTSCTFNLEDVSDNEEIWIMDIPRLVSLDDYRRSGQYSLSVFIFKTVLSSLKMS